MGGFWRQSLLKIARSSARRTLRCKSEPPKGSGTKLFDNRKAGKFTPITLGGLRSVWGSDGVDYYKFCSSMLSSAVDYKASSIQAPEEPRSRKSRSRAIGPRNNGAAGNRANEPKESCGLATAMSNEERKRIVAPRQTTNWVSFMIKLLRAYGGCLGARRRRRTWQAAISLGEPQAGFDPGISE